MRSRLVVALLSFLGFLTFIVMLWLNSAPSSLLHVEPRPLKPHKVSVIVLDVKTNRTKQLCLDIIKALSKHKLEPEFLFSVDNDADFDLQSLKVKGYHMERIAKKPSFTASVIEGFKKAHFTVMAVVGDPAVSVSELLPKLVNPVVNRECDLTLAKHTDTSHILLGLLSFPLTHSLSGGENATSFSLSRAVWLKTCSNLASDASSLSLELLSRCSVHGHKTVFIPGGTPEHVHEAALLAQMFILYWSVHPILSSLFTTTVVVGLLLCGLRSVSRTKLSTIKNTLQIL